MGERITLLITKKAKKTETLTSIEYSAIFTDSKHSLDPLETLVFDMIQQNPDCWSCGCVTGYPENLFTETDRNNLHNHGVGTRFCM